jgi:hypothetical protein
MQWGGRGAVIELKRPAPSDKCFRVEGRRKISQTAMRPGEVIIILPRRQDRPGLCQAREDGLIETLVPQSGIERLDKSVLGWLARRDVVPGDLHRLAPFQNGCAGEFAAIIGDNGLGLAAPGDDPVKFTGHAGAGDRGIGNETQAFPAEVMLNFNNERLALAASAIAHARVAMEEAIAWAQQRKTFGKRLADH